MAGMMDKISAQLDIITRTVITLERRIGDNEEMVNEAYRAYKIHQKNSEIRASIALAQQERRDQEIKEEDEEEDHNEETKLNQSPYAGRDLEETRQKVKNIMNIINISQYTLAAVQKSTQEIHENTTKMQKDFDETKNPSMLRSPIDEESDEDLDRA